MGKLYVDVTNAVDAGYTSGIQRVVREFGASLARDGEVLFLKGITGTEQYEVWSGADFLAFYGGEELPSAQRPRISLDSLGKGDSFFDIDSVWNNFEGRRHAVYPRLKQNGVRILTMVYDVLPIMYPHMFQEETLIHYLIFFSAVISCTDVILVNSEATRKAIRKITREGGFPEKEIRVVLLGADFKAGSSEDLANVRPEVIRATGKPFLMMLGTVEPRKNHGLVLKAYENGLKDLPVNLVIAGREGWKVEDLMEQIEHHPDLNRKIFFLERPSDVEVKYLYEHAWGIIFASLGEGFGLPVIEALHYGKLVFSSDIEVLREVGGDACVYFDPKDPLSLVEKVAETIAYPEKEEELRRRVRDYHVLSWEEASACLKETIRNLPTEEIKARKCPETELVPRQLYIISARPEDLLETLPYYEHWMPWIEEVVIGCPERLQTEFSRYSPKKLKISFLTDEELLQGKPAPKDHVERNMLLRSLAVQSEKLDEVFIMADDDNRPLREVGPDFFIRDGKFQLYYCNEDMSRWHGAMEKPTSYDRGIANDTKLLRELNLPLRQYSSHAPQAICKRIFRELLDTCPDVWKKSVEEWGLYGNFAQAVYPEFFESRPYMTMNWPASPSDWKVTLPPEEYVFENFYRHLYAPGEIFEGFSTKWHEGMPEENLRKVQKRMRQQDDFLAAEKAADLCDEMFFRMYHHMPEWEADLDHGVITVPEILIGPRGHLRKAPFRIRNRSGKAHLRIEGHFEALRTGQTWPFGNVTLDVSGMDGEHVLALNYPDWDASGYLYLTFTVDDREAAKTAVSVITC